MLRRLLLVALLLLALLSLGARPAPDVMALTASQDTYVVADTARADDPQKLRDQNFGRLDFIKVWYASKVQKDEQLVAVGLVGFDLKPLQNRDVESVTLQLFALRTDLAQPARLVDVSLVNGPWAQEEVTFNNRPPWGATPIATTAVYGAGGWYSWDVTASVLREKEAGSVSYAVGLRTVEERKEEQVVFASSKAARDGPRLLITYAADNSMIAWWWPVISAGAVAVALLALWLGGRLFARRRR
jgi:hypothetical protein